MTAVIETTRRARWIAYIAIVLTLAWATAVWAIRFFGGQPVIREAEWWIGGLGLASVYALPAIVGIIAIRGRAYLLRSAGVLCLVLAFSLLVSVVSLPLAIPGVLFLVAGNRVDPESRHHSRTLRVALVTTVAAIGALVALIFTPSDPVCWRETRYADGRVVIVRDLASERQSSDGSHSMTSGPPRGDIVSEAGGCSEGVFPPARTLLALGVVGAATLVTWRMG